LVHVDANGSALGSDLLRRDEHIKTATTAKVDNHFTLMRCHQANFFPMSVDQ
jgi:hypothetical protein